MDKIVIIDDKVDINIKFRTKTKGPELNLVYNFIDNISSNFPKGSSSVPKSQDCIPKPSAIILKFGFDIKCDAI